MRNRIKRNLAFLLATLMTITTVFGNVSLSAVAEEQRTTIAAFNYSADVVFPAGITDGTSAGTLLDIVGATRNGFSSDGLSAIEWTSGGYWLVKDIDASNFSNMVVNAKLRTSNTSSSVLYYNLQYSLDNENWNTLFVTEALSKSLANRIKNVTLPEQLANNTFSLRFLACDGEGNACAPSNSVGTSQINNIVISGIYKGEEPPVITEKCQSVTTTSTVRYGEEFSDTVKLVCETKDATIYYSFNNETGFIAYTEPFAVNAETTVYAYASKEGFEDSGIAELKIAQTKCKQPSVDVKSQSEVEVGQKITATAKSEGDSILYRFNKQGEFIECDGTVLIPDMEGALNIQFIARNAGCLESDKAGVNYTVKKSEVIPPEPVSYTLSSVSDGDCFYLYSNSGKQVLTSTMSGKKLSGVSGEIDEEGKLLIEKTNGNASLVDSLVKLTAKVNAEGFYTFVAKDASDNDVFLTCPSTGSGLSFAKEENDYSLWKVDISDNDILIGSKNALYTDKNQVSHEEYIEFFNGFTTYSYDAGKTERDAFLVTLFKNVEVKDSTTVIDDDDDDESNSNRLSELKDGDLVIMEINGNVLSEEADGKVLKGIAATAGEDGVLEAPEKAAYLKVVVNSDDNTIAFKNAVSGQYLVTGETGSALSFEDSITGLSSWTLEAQEGGFYVKNKDAKYSGTTPQYLEFYKGFTTYSLKNGGVAYLTNFYKVSLPVMADTSVTKTVAQWAGNVNYEAEGLANEIPGDLFTTNDLKDSSAMYTAVLSGSKSQAYTSSTSSTTGSTSYYMGATGVGSGTNDYLQFELSSLGYANMKMAFRLRASNTGAGEYTLKYSTDGEKFENFTTGSYSCSYTQYKSDSSSENVTKEGEITNGIAKASLAPTYYVSFSFDVPKGASNAEKLYIRLCPGNTKAKGDGTPSSSGVIRIDSVVITGNPVIDESVCSYVKATPDSGNIAVGEVVKLSTATEGAKIFYSLNEGDYVEYAEGVSISTLPSTLVAYATKDGIKNGAKSVYLYSQAQCEPVKATPNGGAVVKGTKVTLRDNTEGVKILYRLSDTEVWTEYTEPFTLDEVPCTYYVKASKEGFIDSPQGTLNFTERTNEKYNIYFGQIHSHTTISDGAGSLEEAFKHAKGVANLDYIVVTDHSNSFDGADKGDITKNTDSAETDEWTYAHKLAEEMSDDKFTCMYGYEMTWSNGLGHMNTYNTEGFQSRTQKDYSTYSTALNNYYTALEKVPDSISMFNHPGTTFGDFQDFAYFSEARDNLINLIEVGNGEGAIGSSGYFPSYEYYTRALDKGWHVAPTNNQDNHKGLWGDANTARTVALCDKNAELDYYDAMRNHRVYATEDNDLSIYYTLDGYIMGSILSEDETGDTVKLVAELSDPTDSSIGKISVIVNGGLEIASKDVTSNKETVTFEVPNNYSYYYLKIVEKDGDIAVTAPVWTGDVEACGISSVTTTTALPVSGDPIDINLELYNNEKSALSVYSINIDLLDAEGVSSHIETIEGDELGEVKEVVSNGTLSYSFKNVYEGAGNVTYEITVNASLNGVEKVYTGKLSANYVVPDMVGEIVIDGTHANDYVSGYYAGNVNNFINLAADFNLRAKVVTDKITADTLKDCKLLVIAPPASKTGEANGVQYSKMSFEDEFIEAVKNYVLAGGSVIICGIADYSNYKAAAEQNKLLSAIGSTIRVNSDEVMDDTNNGGQNYRLYPENFDMTSSFLGGVVCKGMGENYQKYSQYSGCSIDVSDTSETEFVTPARALVKGFDTTYSVNCKDEDNNSAGNTKNDNLGDVTFLAQQYTKTGGSIFVSGGVFLSDFEIKIEMDNVFELPYANYTIAKNILAEEKIELQVSSIAEARKGNMGDVFAVEGFVTSGTDNDNTTFFDTIYIQDETGGIDIFPYSDKGLAIGTKVRIVGYVSEYQGDRELKVLSGEIFGTDTDEKKVYEPKELSTKEAMDYDTYGGSLLKTTGTVTRVSIENGALAEFWLMDDSGKEAAIFIDGYIYSATTGRNDLANTVKVGATVSAVGVLYMHPEGSSDVSVPVFRVRNCDEINVIKAAPVTPSQPASDDHSSDSHSSEPTVTPAKETPSLAPANEQVVAVPGRVIAGNTTVANEKVEASDVQKVETNEDNDKLEEKEITDELSPKSDAAGLTDDENSIIGGEQTPMAAEAPKQANSLGIIFVIVGCALALTVCIFAVYKKKGMKKEN